MTNATNPEAEILFRKSQRLSRAHEELSRSSTRLPSLLIWLAPSLLMIPFGESLANSFGIASQGTWLLLFLAAAALAIGHEVYLLQRKVAALTEVVRSTHQRDA